MVFSSLTFLFWFLPITLLITFAFKKVSVRNLILLIASLLFYAWGEKGRVLIMVFTILGNYLIGKWIENKRDSNTPITIGVGVNLLLLLICKYTNFIVDNLNTFLPDDYLITIKHIPLPIGISFFTFQAISYLIDVHRKETPAQKNVIHLGLYISLFPQLIAGPIVRYHDVAEQIKKRTNNSEKFAEGIQRFILGLSKKIFIANTLGLIADNIFSNPLNHISTPLAWLGIVTYSLQIYFDFSGYSDMAIGLGKMLGFDFLENFNLPYISSSIQEFWRRWHISLSTWFRDYLYIPLGGNRKSPIRTYLNLIAVFFVTGLWHGASWNFVIWGLFHGLFLILERIGLSTFLNSIPKIFSHIYTITIVLIGWVFFRSENLTYSLDFISRLFIYTNNKLIQYQLLDYLNTEVILSLTAGILASTPILARITKYIYTKNSNIYHISKYSYITLLFILCVISLINSSYNPFIYFRF